MTEGVSGSTVGEGERNGGTGSGSGSGGNGAGGSSGSSGSAAASSSSGAGDEAADAGAYVAAGAAGAAARRSSLRSSGHQGERESRLLIELGAAAHDASAGTPESQVGTLAYHGPTLRSGRVCVRASTLEGAGRGLFANDVIEVTDFILYGGEVISGAEAQRRRDCGAGQYIMQLLRPQGSDRIDGRTVAEAVSAQANEEGMYLPLVEWVTDVGPGPLVNSSRQRANLVLQLRYLDKSRDLGPYRVLKPKYTITRGEELLFDYGFERHQPEVPAAAATEEAAGSCEAPAVAEPPAVAAPARGRTTGGRGGGRRPIVPRRVQQAREQAHTDQDAATPAAAQQAPDEARREAAAVVSREWTLARIASSAGPYPTADPRWCEVTASGISQARAQTYIDLDAATPAAAQQAPSEAKPETAVEHDDFDGEEGEWSATRIVLDSSKALWRSLAETHRAASVVWRRVDGEWRSTLIVLQSANLAQEGLVEWGLYPLRDFKGDELIAGHYPGVAVYSGFDENSREAKRIVTPLLKAGHDRLLLASREDGTGVRDIIDGAGLPPMYRANAVTGIKGAVKRFRFTKTGSACAQGNVRALPSDYEDRTLDDIKRFELLTTYQAGFWRGHKKHGKSAATAAAAPAAAQESSQRSEAGAAGGSDSAVVAASAAVTSAPTEAASAAAAAIAAAATAPAAPTSAPAAVAAAPAPAAAASASTAAAAAVRKQTDASNVARLPRPPGLERSALDAAAAALRQPDTVPLPRPPAQESPAADIDSAVAAEALKRLDRGEAVVGFIALSTFQYDPRGGLRVGDAATIEDIESPQWTAGQMALFSGTGERAALWIDEVIVRESVRQMRVACNLISTLAAHTAHGVAQVHMITRRYAPQQMAMRRLAGYLGLRPLLQAQHQYHFDDGPGGQARLPYAPGESGNSRRPPDRREMYLLAPIDLVVAQAQRAVASGPRRFEVCALPDHMVTTCGEALRGLFDAVHDSEGGDDATYDDVIGRHVSGVGASKLTIVVALSAAAGDTREQAERPAETPRQRGAAMRGTLNAWLAGGPGGHVAEARAVVEAERQLQAASASQSAQAAGDAASPAPEAAMAPSATAGAAKEQGAPADARQADGRSTQPHPSVGCKPLLFAAFKDGEKLFDARAEGSQDAAILAAALHAGSPICIVMGRPDGGNQQHVVRWVTSQRRFTGHCPYGQAYDEYGTAFWPDSALPKSLKGRVVSAESIQNYVEHILHNGRTGPDAIVVYRLAVSSGQRSAATDGAAASSAPGGEMASADGRATALVAGALPRRQQQRATTARAPGGASAGGKRRMADDGAASKRVSPWQLHALPQQTAQQAGVSAQAAGPRVGTSVQAAAAGASAQGADSRRATAGNAQGAKREREEISYETDDEQDGGVRTVLRTGAAAPQTSRTTLPTHYERGAAGRREPTGPDRSDSEHAGYHPAAPLDNKLQGSNRPNPSIEVRVIDAAGDTDSGTRATRRDRDEAAAVPRAQAARAGNRTAQRAGLYISDEDALMHGSRFERVMPRGEIWDGVIIRRDTVQPHAWVVHWDHLGAARETMVDLDPAFRVAADSDLFPVPGIVRQVGQWRTVGAQGAQPTSDDGDDDDGSGGGSYMASPEGEQSAGGSAGPSSSGGSGEAGSSGRSSTQSASSSSGWNQTGATSCQRATSRGGLPAAEGRVTSTAEGEPNAAQGAEQTARALQVFRALQLVEARTDVKTHWLPASVEASQLSVATACAVCGDGSAPLVHQGSGIYLCGSSKDGRTCSCLWLYLAACDTTHRTVIRLGAGDTDEGATVRCVASATPVLWQGSTLEHVRLGVVPALNREVQIVVSAAAMAQNSNAKFNIMRSDWSPLATPEAAHSLIAEAPQRQRRPPRITAQRTYDSVLHYRETWRALLGAVAAHDRDQHLARSRTGLRVQWQFDVNGIRNIALVAEIAGNVKLGDQFDLLEEPHKEGEAAWRGTGVLRRLQRDANGSQTASLQMREYPAADEMEHLNKATWTVTPHWNVTNYERSQTALMLFSSGDSTFTSPELVSSIVGTAMAATSLRARLPPASLTPPGMRDLDSSQEAAVRACLSRRLALIQGPPGTGKTATTAAALYHLVRQGSGSVLAVAASNTAATRLATVAQQIDLRVLRHLSRAREADAASMHEHLTLQHHAAAVDSRSAAALEKLLQLKREFDPLAKGDEELLQDLRADVEIQAMRRADVVVCTLLAAGDIAIARHTFKVVVIDEAAQADEPSTLVPITLGCERLIAVGDQNQLGPVVAHQPSQRAGYGVSMFQRLASGLVSPCLLNRQYRMHPWLAQYPSDAFYEGRLVNGVTVEQRCSDVAWPVEGVPGYMHAVQHDDRFVGTSRANDGEADVVVDTVRWLLRSSVRAKAIGIIATYGAQVGNIRKRLDAGLEVADAKDVTVNTVDSYQGQELSFIIVSMVRGTPGGSLRFLESAQRLNVAMTRCQLGRIVVCNPAVLKGSTLLAALVNYHAEQGVLLQGSPGQLQAHADNKPSAPAFVAEHARVPSEAPELAAARREFRSVFTGAAVVWRNRQAQLDWLMAICRPLVALALPGRCSVTVEARVANRLLGDTYERGDAAGFLRLRERFADAVSSVCVYVAHSTDDGGWQFSSTSKEDAIARWVAALDGSADSSGGNSQGTRNRNVICVAEHALDDRERSPHVHISEMPQPGQQPFGLCALEAASDGEWCLFTQLPAKAQRRQPEHVLMRAQHRRGLFSRMLFLWRGRVMGYLSSEDTVLYWRYAHAGQKSKFASLVKRARYCVRNDGSFGYGKGTLPDGWGPLHVSDRTRVPVRHAFKDRATRALLANERCNGRYYRAVRRCLCWYGMRQALGLATTEQQRLASRVEARRHIAYYAESLAGLRAQVPDFAALARFANPGGHSEALRRLGLQVVAVDNAPDLDMATRWFHELAQTSKGQAGVDLIHKGGRVSISHGDALSVDDVSAAARAHAQQHMDGRMAVGAHFDTPPCAPYGPLTQLHLSRANKVVQYQACFATVVAQRATDYKLRKEVFVVESTAHAGHYITSDVSVCYVEGYDVGIASRDRHTIVTPKDRPFVRDAALKRLGAQIAAGSCAGERPVSALHPCGVPVQTHWSPPCCTGNSFSFVGAGVQAAGLARACSELGLSSHHLTDLKHASDVLPVLISMWPAAQMINQAFSVVTGTPFITCESSDRDTRLRQWRTDFITAAEQHAQLAGFPLTGVYVFVMPPQLSGQVVLQSSGRPIFRPLPTNGVDLTLLVEQAIADLPLGVLASNLRFVAHRRGKVAFYSSFMADDVPASTSRGRKKGGGGVAGSLASASLRAERIQNAQDRWRKDGRTDEELADAAALLQLATEMAAEKEQQAVSVSEAFTCTSGDADLREGEAAAIAHKIAARWEARARRDYKAADKLVKELEEAGVVLCDESRTYYVKREPATTLRDTGLTAVGGSTTPLDENDQGQGETDMGTCLIAAQEEQVGANQRDYARRRQALLRGTKHAGQPAFSSTRGDRAAATDSDSEEEEETEDGGNKRSQRLSERRTADVDSALVLVRQGDRLITRTHGHRVAELIGGAVPYYTGAELRIRGANDDSPPWWQHKRVLWTALEPLVGGSAIEGVLQHLVAEATTGSSVYASRTYRALDYLGRNNGTVAVSRRVNYTIYDIALEDTVDWVQVATDPTGDRLPGYRGSDKYRTYLFRTARASGGLITTPIAPRAAAAVAEAAASFQRPVVSDAILVGSQLVSSGLEELRVHLARTGRGHIANALREERMTRALAHMEEEESGAHLPQQVGAALLAAADNSRVRLQLQPIRGTTDKPTFRVTTLQNIMGVTDVMQQFERRGDATQRALRVPMSRAQFEQLIRRQEEQYVVHLAPWPGKLSDLSTGQTIHFTNTVDGFTAAAVIVEGLSEAAQQSGQSHLFGNLAGRVRGIGSGTLRVRLRRATDGYAVAGLRPGSTESVRRAWQCLRALRIIQEAAVQYLRTRRAERLRFVRQSKAAVFLQTWIRHRQRTDRLYACIRIQRAFRDWSTMRWLAASQLQSYYRRRRAMARERASQRLQKASRHLLRKLRHRKWRVAVSVQSAVRGHRARRIAEERRRAARVMEEVRRRLLELSTEGTRVEVRGLKQSAQYNGQTGSVVGWDEAAGRVSVLLDGGSGDTIRVKRANLSVAPQVDDGAASATRAARAARSRQALQLARFRVAVSAIRVQREWRRRNRRGNVSDDDSDSGSEMLELTDGSDSEDSDSGQPVDGHSLAASVRRTVALPPTESEVVPDLNDEEPQRHWLTPMGVPHELWQMRLRAAATRLSCAARRLLSRRRVEELRAEAGRLARRQRAAARKLNAAAAIWLARHSKGRQCS